jgi:hypothetical protein
MDPRFLRLARHLPVRLAVFALVAAALVWTTLPDATHLNEFRDVHHLFLYERAAIDTIKRFGELPLWNPYYCGGFDAVGAPQTRFMSPTILLGLLFGAERAEILTVFTLAIVGMEGMYRWLRLRVESAPAAMLIAPVFALSGQFTVAYYRGWIQFFGFELLPWLLFGVALAARRKPIGMVIAAIAFATMLGFAGFFAVPLVAVAATIEAVRGLAEAPRDRQARAFAMLFATAVFMVMVAWVRVWPVAETLASAPRIMAGAPGNSPRTIVASLVGLLQVKEANTQIDGSFYVGPAFLGIVALGLQYRRAAVVLPIAFLCLWLAAGYSAHVSAFAMLRRVPGLTAIRYPERFTWLAIFFGSELAAYAVMRVPRATMGKAWRAAALLTLAGGIAWTCTTQILAFHRVAGARTLGVVEENVFGEFHNARGNRWKTVHFESMGIGSLGCYETHRLAQSRLLRGDLPAEEYVAPQSAGAGTVKRVSWSPTSIVVHAAMTKPGRMLVNQNWAPGWHSSVGEIVSNEGLLGVDLPAGESDVTLTFRPWSTVGGALVTATALASLAFLVWRRRKRGPLFARKTFAVTSMAVLLPCVVAGVAYAASPDPKWKPQPLTNANGEPSLLEPGEVSALPKATVTAAFDVPIQIEAAWVRGPDLHKTITVHMILRRTGSVPRSTTMFVHVRRKKGQGDVPKGKEDFENADHQIMGGSFFLSEMPEGEYVRDVFGANLAKGASGGWEIWIAFGHVAGDRGRIAVKSTGNSEVKDDMVKIGEIVLP